MKNITLTTDCHDSCGEPSTKKVSRDELLLLAASGVQVNGSAELLQGLYADELLDKFVAALPADEVRDFNSCSPQWKFLNVLIHTHKWSKWDCRTNWSVA